MRLHVIVLLVASISSSSSSQHSSSQHNSQETCANAAIEGQAFRVQVTDGFLTLEEARQLLAKYGNRATVDYDPSYGSASTYLRGGDDVNVASAPLLHSVGKRAAELVAAAGSLGSTRHLNNNNNLLANAEYPVITRYLIGESYGIHGDAAYFNRTHTVLIYLQVPAGGGGETIFPWWDKKADADQPPASSLAQLCTTSSDGENSNDNVLRVKPVVGRAVVWPNLSPATGKPDRRAFHGSCPVLRPEKGVVGGGAEAKWVVQFWFDDKVTKVWPEES